MGDIVEFPEFGQRVFKGSEEGLKHMAMPACTGPIAVEDTELVQRDIADLRAGTQGVDVFLSAPSPGEIALFLENQHYPSREATSW